MRLRELRRDMAGINPKLSIWGRLDTEAKQIEVELASMGAERTKIK